MDRNHWEKIAPGYEEEIFDVLKNDSRSLIKKSIRAAASQSKTVLDAGCAVGKWLPVLSPLFKKVIAADISAKNLSIASDKHSDLLNIEYLRSDLSGRIRLPKADVVVCINAILTSSPKKQEQFLTNISSCLAKSGTLILVVPSLESWLLTRIVQGRWKIDEAMFKDRIAAKEGLKRYRDIQKGNAEIDNVPTKHYLREELEIILSHHKIEVSACKKIEYAWTTEFVRPPKWLRRPSPWDWLVIGNKT